MAGTKCGDSWPRCLSVVEKCPIPIFYQEANSLVVTSYRTHGNGG